MASLMSAAPSASLLGPLDPTPVELCHADGGAALLLTCDHASAAVPRALADLGLPPAALRQHIAWDIGAAAVTRRLAAALDASAILAGFSRLVVDCNRDPADASSIPLMSDGMAVPGNRELTQAARAARLAACFGPYHAA